MELYALVSIEVREQNKACQVMHITIGGNYINRPNEKELFATAQEYVYNDRFVYRLLGITYLSKEQYCSFLQGQIADYLRSE